MRPARALIDLEALRANYRLARRTHGGRALAVIKANAYGHGAVACARGLEGEADGFAVACIEEAETLRAAGIGAPILLLEGVFEPDELSRADALGLWLVVHHRQQLEMLEACEPAQPFNIWLKLNTGMNRAGFVHRLAPDLCRRLEAMRQVGELTLMTHFARADEPMCDATETQLANFRGSTLSLALPTSLCNSAAILAWPQTHGDWARPGIMLYGADPLPGEAHGLRPVMTLESRVMAVRDVAPGDAVGYGARFVAERATRVGLVAMGYADGYPRSVGDGTPVSVDGQAAAIVGRVSMDMLSVDLSELPGAGPGSRVELWGAEVPVNRIAAAAGTIAYELLCNVKRARLEYTGA